MILLKVLLIFELALQNVIMADHRQVNRSEMKGNYFRRKNYDNSRSYQISPDSPCSYDSQCAGYPLARCNSVCQCVERALNTGTTCVSSVAALQSSVSCPAGQTYVKEAGVCMTVQQPGEPCQYSQQCSALEPGAFCLKMRCECVYGMKKSSNGCTLVNTDCKERGHIFISELGECREVIPPGRQGCSHNSQCSAAYPDATCFMQTCSCPPNLPVAADGTCGRKCGEGFVYSGVTGECLPEVQPGGTCLYSSQCHSTYGGMVCDQNTCRCPNGLIFDGMKCAQSCPAYRRFVENNLCVETCSPGKVDVNGECLKKVSIGQSCTASAQCSSGSFCQKGKCLCAPGFYVVNDQCQAIEAEPNTSCSNNEKCTKGSICYNGRCTCPKNHELVNGFCQANRAVPIGSSCVRVGVTCDGGSVCVAGICVCPLGKTPRNGFCIKHVTALPGASCADGEECIENSSCDEESMKCECVSQTQMVVGNRCIERLRSHPGYGCALGEMCVGNSICNNGKCECAQGKVEINKVCVDEVYAKIGETCGKGILCQGGSYCNTDSGKCGCPKGQREIHGECKQVVLAYPGESCVEMTSRCAGGSYCVRGRCECPFSMTLVDKKCVVQQTANPGEGCNENTACSGFSVCKDNTCTCVNEMIVRDKVCVQRRKVNIGSTCDQYDQCLGNSNCVENHCQCQVGHVVSGNVCAPRKTVTPGYLCNSEDICTGQSVCIKGVCQCKPNYKQMHNICVKNSLGVEGSLCSTREDCSDTFVCDNGVCSCSKGMFSVNGKCRSYISLGHTCTTDDKCVSTDAMCFENKCTCKPGLTVINGECHVPTTTAPPTTTTTEPEVLAQMRTQRCFASNQCPSGANCVRGECKCKPGLGLSKMGFCIPINYADPGTSCAHGERCRSESQCIDGICVCNEPLILKENKCVRSPRDPAPPRRRVSNDELTVCPADGSCQLPDCFCSVSGKIPPNNMEVKKVPQMVVLTFDDPITDRIINTLKSLFSGRIRNPNGCAIKGTFYISHQWNNYDQSQWLYSKGNEIGVNSITREDLSERTKERWLREQKGMRDTLSEFSYIEKSQIIGTRAPASRLGGDLQFEMLAENNFTFDNSMLVNGLYWPQTLDHKLSWECEGKCPQRSHKNVWEIPIQNIQANDGNWYPTLGRALKPSDSRTSVKQILMRNFLNNYKSNRAPYVLTLSTDFLTYLPDNGAIYALEDFLKEIVLKNDVYITTGSQVIDWMRKPTPIDSLKSLRSWQCSFLMNDQVQPCESPSVCTYNSRSRGQLAHSFRICGSCPRNYPWVQ